MGKPFLCVDGCKECTPFTVGFQLSHFFVRIGKNCKCLRDSCRHQAIKKGFLGQVEAKKPLMILSLYVDTGRYLPRNPPFLPGLLELEEIAHAAHGNDMGGYLGAHFGAHATDVHVHRTGATAVLEAPDAMEQRLAGVGA